MSDPVDLLLSSGAGAAVVGALWGTVKALGARSVNALDKTLEHLDKSIEKQGVELKGLIGDLTREVRTLRDTDIRQAEQIGGLQKGLADLEKRVDGQASHYRALLDEHRESLLESLHKSVEEVARRTRRR